MRAITVDPAEAGKLIVSDVPDPAPLPNEALVRVRAISLNRGEVNMTRHPRPNWRPGWDLAGEVVHAAADGSGPKEGARVVGIVKSGAWAEFVAVPTSQLGRLPDSVSFAEAATLPVAGLTAMHALWKGGFLLERPVLITGATGGVGDYAIQLARLVGARVVAQVRRADQEDQVRESGAHEVVVGEDLEAARPFGPYALILDSVGGTVLSQALGLVEEGTRVVLFGTSSGAQVSFDAGHFFGVGMASLYGMILFDELKTVEAASVGLERLAGLIAQDRLKARISVEAVWTEADSVARSLLARSYPGKAVLHIA